MAIASAVLGTSGHFFTPILQWMTPAMNIRAAWTVVSGFDFFKKDVQMGRGHVVEHMEGVGGGMGGIYTQMPLSMYQFSLMKEI